MNKIVLDDLKIVESLTDSITYDLDGVKLPADAKNTITVADGDYSLPIPTKDGYEFLGWTKGDMTEPTYYLTVNALEDRNATVKAHWLKINDDIKLPQTGQNDSFVLWLIVLAFIIATISAYKLKNKDE